MNFRSCNSWPRLPLLYTAVMQGSVANWTKLFDFPRSYPSECPVGVPPVATNCRNLIKVGAPPTFSIAPHYHITHYPQLGVPMWSTLPCGVARRGVQLWCPDVVHITHITHYHVVWLGEVSKMQTKKAPERVLEPFK